MGILTRMRKQDAVYWAPYRRNSYGEMEYHQPEEIKVTWFDEFVQGIDREGRETVFEATVFVGVLEDGSDVKLDGMLFLGKLEDLDGPLPPPHNAKKIRKFTKIPKRKEFLRVASL